MAAGYPRKKKKHIWTRINRNLYGKCHDGICRTAGWGLLYLAILAANNLPAANMGSGEGDTPGYLIFIKFINERYLFMNLHYIGIHL